MSDFKLISVNWQDGMLISRHHLTEQEKYIEELARWERLETGQKYGLIRKSFEGQGALSLHLSVSGNFVAVEAVRCQAITPNGHIIEINETIKDPVKCEGEISNSTMPVYIGLNIESKKQWGDPDPNEDMPRLPYQIGNYEISLSRPNHLPDGDFIQVAELTINGSEVNLSGKYYPPCVTLYADERLAAKLSDYKSRLDSLLSVSTRAYKAIGDAGALAGEGTSLQLDFKETIHPFVHYLASNIDSLKSGPSAGHPQDLVIFFRKLYRVLSTLLGLHSGLKDFLNEKFFTVEINTDVNAFLSSIEGYILTEYNHNDIGGLLSVNDEILEQVRLLMAFLAQTRKEELGEQAVATETLTYTGRTYHNAPYGDSKLDKSGELCYLQVPFSNSFPVSDVVILINKDLFSDSEWRSMQVRLGINEARGLGETDPIDIDTVTYGNKTAFHPRDMLESSSVKQLTLVFRGVAQPEKFASLGKMDLIIYTV